MKKEEKIFIAYLAVMAIFSASIIAVPFVAFSDEETGEKVYSLFSPLCHQKLSRSYCIFHDELGYYAGDCTPQNGTFVPGDQRLISSEQDGYTGYKLPVCSRDVGLYFAMLFGAVAYPFIRRIEDRNLPPPVYLVMAIVPIALDGGIQFISDFGILPFVYESTNIIRFLSGAIAGFIMSLYIIPLLMNLLGKD